MLKAFKGRIDRKTFIIGNVVGLTILSFAALIYIVPVAIIDLLITNVAKLEAAQPVFSVLYSLFIVPSALFLFFFSVLFVRRLHDIGYPGMLILFSLIAIQVLSQVLDNYLLNVLAVLIIIFVALAPGQKGRNNFGAKPHKKFSFKELTVRL